MTVIKLELKYCERCGSLRLRQANTTSTYCRPCTQLLDRFVVVSLAGTRSRRHHRRLQTEGHSQPTAGQQVPLVFGRLQ